VPVSQLCCRPLGRRVMPPKAQPCPHPPAGTILEATTQSRDTVSHIPWSPAGSVRSGRPALYDSACGAHIMNSPPRSSIRHGDGSGAVSAGAIGSAFMELYFGGGIDYSVVSCKRPGSTSLSIGRAAKCRAWIGLQVFCFRCGLT
jgi:hypothetical protein